jgi:hypothetical protein
MVYSGRMLFHYLQRLFGSAGNALGRIVMFLASLVRFLLIVLAGLYVWKAVKRAIWGGTRASTPPPDRSQQSIERFEDAEDIEFEDIE